MTDPWDWYIYLHEWLIFYGKLVGRYTSPMDGMGLMFTQFLSRIWGQAFRRKGNHTAIDDGSEILPRVGLVVHPFFLHKVLYIPGG